MDGKSDLRQRRISAWDSYGLLPELEIGETNDSGLGGFFNAPPGLASMSALHVETNTELSSRRFLIRASWISAVAAGPSIGF